MKLLCSVFSSNKFKIFILCLFSSVNTAWSEPIQQLLAAPIFSDPGILSDVPKGWKSKPLKYEKVHRDISYITPSQLRRTGWKFQGNELVGEPGIIEALKQ